MQMIPSLFLFRLGAQAQSPVGAEVSWKQKADLDAIGVCFSKTNQSKDWQLAMAGGTWYTHDSKQHMARPRHFHSAPLNLLLEISVPEPIMAAGGQCSCD